MQKNKLMNRKVIIKAIRALDVVLAIGFASLAITYALSLTAKTLSPGSLQDKNVVINNKQLDKTSTVVIIPKGRRETIKVTDDGYWNSIVAEAAGENWRGVYVKGREIVLGPYCMAQYPVTQELFAEVMGFNPCYFKKENLNVKYTYNGRENPELRPADTISWFDAVVFCNKLTLLTMDKTDCAYYADSTYSHIYTEEDHHANTIPFYNVRKKGYRLPTEAEWEFATRGGNVRAHDWNFAFSGTGSDNKRIVYDTVQYSFRDTNFDKYGWYRGNSNGVTHEVGTKLPNALGLYDLSGNVWEWLYDWYDSAVDTGRTKNPLGASSGTDRVLRGGSWFEDAYTCCVTRRFHNGHPYIPHFYFGFRYCRSL